MLSIIIPALNEEKYLPRLLESLRNQDFKGEYEIIVADAGSFDKTKEIARNFGCRVVLGGRPAEGRNRGAQVARGEILLFIDADASLPEDFLKKALLEFSSRELDSAGFLVYPQSPKKIYRFIFSLYNLFAKLFEKKIPLGWTAILTKKAIHLQIKGFDEKITIGEDHWYLKKASKIGRCGIIKSTKVFASPRRFEKEGVFRLCLKYILVGLYILLFGPPKKEIIKYEFNHYQDN